MAGSNILACPPPDPRPRPPRFAVPARACDSHAHIIGPAARHPFVEDRSYTPPDALLPDYLAVLRTLGLQRAVLVQPSMYGLDNSVMMKAIAACPSVEMRAVVVVPPEIGEDELAVLHQQGARGVRLNLVYSGGGMGFEVAARIAEKIRPFGWHLQLLMDVSQAADALPGVGALKVPVVVDHLGHLPASRGVRDKGFAALLELVRRGNTWIKLSGAYRLTGQDFPYDDVRPFAEALIEAGSDRLVWGTDWPHTVCRVRMPNDGELLDLLHDWAGDETLLRKILVHNPAQLYDFRDEPTAI